MGQTLADGQWCVHVAKSLARKGIRPAEGRCGSATGPAVPSHIGALPRRLAPIRNPGPAFRTNSLRRQRHLDQRMTPFVEPMILIFEPPAGVVARQFAGHWEGDLIMGRKNRSPRPRWSNAPPATSSSYQFPTVTPLNTSAPPSSTP